MALLKTGSGITSISGRFGGVYFQRGSAGQLVKAMPRTVRYTPSGTKGLLVMAFTKMAQYWKLIASLVVMGYWINFAKQNLYTRKDGTQIVMCPRNWFCHYNVKRIYLEQNVWYYPPRSNWQEPPYYAAGQAFGRYGNPLYEVGTYNGEKLYKFAVGSLLCWWDGDMWWVSSSPGYKPPNYCWFRPSPDIEGTYIPINPVDEGIYVTS